VQTKINDSSLGALRSDGSFWRLSVSDAVRFGVKPHALVARQHSCEWFGLATTAVQRIGKNGVCQGRVLGGAGVGVEAVERKVAFVLL